MKFHNILHNTYDMDVGVFYGELFKYFRDVSFAFLLSYRILDRCGQAMLKFLCCKLKRFLGMTSTFHRSPRDSFVTLFVERIREIFDLPAIVRCFVRLSLAIIKIYWFIEHDDPRSAERKVEGLRKVVNRVTFILHCVLEILE